MNVIGMEQDDMESTDWMNSTQNHIYYRNKPKNNQQNGLFIIA